LNPSAEANGAQKRQVAAPVHRPSVDVFVTFPNPGVAPAHRQVQPGLIEKD
jgi:hypothetical protein